MKTIDTLKNSYKARIKSIKENQFYVGVEKEMILKRAKETFKKELEILIKNH